MTFSAQNAQIAFLRFGVFLIKNGDFWEKPHRNWPTGAPYKTGPFGGSLKTPFKLGPILGGAIFGPSFLAPKWPEMQNEDILQLNKFGGARNGHHLRPSCATGLHSYSEVIPRAPICACAPMSVITPPNPLSWVHRDSCSRTGPPSPQGSRAAPTVRATLLSAGVHSHGNTIRPLCCTEQWVRIALHAFSTHCVPSLAPCVVASAPLLGALEHAIFITRFQDQQRARPLDDSPFSYGIGDAISSSHKSWLRHDFVLNMVWGIFHHPKIIRFHPEIHDFIMIRGNNKCTHISYMMGNSST